MQSPEPPSQPAERASASILALGVLVAAAFLLAVLTAVGESYVAHAELQQAADIAATTVERVGGDAPRERAVELARANGAARVRVTRDESSPEGGERIRIDVSRRVRGVFGSRPRTIRARTWAVLPVVVAGDGGPNPPGVYAGPLVVVDGVRVCPAVAAAYTRMDAAAGRDGITLTPTSGFRGYAEQAVLYARLGPGLAAPPGTSRHHDGTELDINVGPAGSSIHRWLQAHGPSHGFVQRYSWEPWHWGFVAGC